MTLPQQEEPLQPRGNYCVVRTEGDAVVRSLPLARPYSESDILGIYPTEKIAQNICAKLNTGMEILTRHPVGTPCHLCNGSMARHEVGCMASAAHGDFNAERQRADHLHKVLTDLTTQIGEVFIAMEIAKLGSTFALNKIRNLCAEALLLTSSNPFSDSETNASQYEAPCSICGDQTEYLCADCAINRRGKIRVCRKPECRDMHESTGEFHRKG